MADERDLELLDDYLTNRMSEQDRSAFEQRLQADPDLQHEHALQKRLIKGIQDARVSELKAMLNQVSVPSSGPVNTLGVKLALGTVGTLMIAAATYWFVSVNNGQSPIRTAPAEQVTEEPETPSQKLEAPEEKRETPLNKPGTEEDVNQTSAGTEESKPSLAKKPKPVPAPEHKSKDQSSVVLEPGAGARTSDEATDPGLKAAKSTLTVETDLTNSRYKFHYQFLDGKLVLYGPFDSTLYEIMEFSTADKRTVFLYYNDRFYRLDEVDTAIRALQPVTDATLLKKLEQHRSSK